MTRKEYNKKIVEKLNTLIDRYPDQRFGQLISNYVLDLSYDPFFEESKQTYERISESESRTSD